VQLTASGASDELGTLPMYVTPATMLWSMMEASDGVNVLVSVHTWKRDHGPETMQYADAPIQRGDHGILLASMEVEEHGRAGKAWYQSLL